MPGKEKRKQKESLLFRWCHRTPLSGLHAAPCCQATMEHCCSSCIIVEPVPGLHDDTASRTAAGFSHSSGRTCRQDSSARAVIQVVLVHLQLDTPDQGYPPSAFHRWILPLTKVILSHSPDFLKELHSCWRDTLALTRPGLDERTLAAMEDEGPAGLLCMPAVESQIAALIVVAEEAMRCDPRCPSAQCKMTTSAGPTTRSHALAAWGIACPTVNFTAGGAEGRLRPGHLGCLAAGVWLLDLGTRPAYGDASPHPPPCLAGAVAPHGGEAQGPPTAACRAWQAVRVGHPDATGPQRQGRYQQASAGGPPKGLHGQDKRRLAVGGRSAVRHSDAM